MWQRLAEQIPVVVAFIVFASILFKAFLAELARKDSMITKTLDSILEDGAKRETVRDDKYINSFEQMTSAHDKALMRLTNVIKGFKN